MPLPSSVLNIVARIKLVYRIPGSISFYFYPFDALRSLPFPFTSRGRNLKSTESVSFLRNITRVGKNDSKEGNFASIGGKKIRWVREGGYHPFLSEVIECSNSVGWCHTVTFYFARTYVRTYLRSCLRGKKRERAASRSIEREREIFSLPISVWNNREREREKRKGGKRSFCFLLRNIIIA